MTMSSQQEKLEALLSDSERHERKARRRALLFSLIPIVLAGMLLGYTIWQIQAAQDDLAGVEEKLSDTQQILDETTIEYERTETTLSQVQGDLSDSQVELMDANGQLEQIQVELQTAHALVTETQNKLDETTLELRTAQEELQITQQRMDGLEVQLEKLNQDITFAEDQLQRYREAETFEPFLCNINPERAKDWPGYLYAYYSDKQADVFNHLMRLQLQGVKFSIHGSSLKDGFNSPNFAVYVLQENGLLPPDYDPTMLPWEQLQPVRSPDQGDLIYYKSGYTMFYFFTGEQKCVIGMTPAGIISLTPEFAETIGYLQVPYPNR
jgi:hypothetical protein